MALKQFEVLALSNYVNSLEGNFNEKLDDVLKNYKNLDVFFVDGNHTFEATMDYFNKALPKAHNDSVFIFDDIYWSPGMTNAWEEIKQNNNVYQTVDLFFIGLGIMLIKKSNNIEEKESSINNDNESEEKIENSNIGK